VLCYSYTLNVSKVSWLYSLTPVAGRGLVSWGTGSDTIWWGGSPVQDLVLIQGDAQLKDVSLGIFVTPRAQVIPSSDFSSSVRCKKTTNHISYHPINYWELVCIITLLQQSWNVWQGTLPTARGNTFSTVANASHLATTLSWKPCFWHNTCTKLEKTQTYDNTHHRQHNPIHTSHHTTNSYVSTIHKCIIIFTYNS
jgi:hypothetical protein